MTWFELLGVVVAIVAICAVFFVRPRGGRPADSTRLMTAARITLGLVALIIIGTIVL